MKTPHPAIANIRAQLEIMDTNEHYSKWRMHRALTALDALEKEMQVMGDGRKAVERHALEPSDSETINPIQLGDALNIESPAQRDDVLAHLRNNIANVLDHDARYYKAEVGDRLSNIFDLTDAILREIKPYQAEPVSLRGCAKVVQMAARDGNDSPQDYGDAERIAKAVLDEAGVPYVD